MQQYMIMNNNYLLLIINIFFEDLKMAELVVNAKTEIYYRTQL